ncbi:uncharacterized protein LOC110766792 [Prunus avium]|uniref:Uncharacterized protein LOC110766792 n=1 Tax=Prunus avium TaxID=42229 RepID=A0A6P5TFG8_PRUAV|nr:uncharacterized protein LOC110766792 [Prunus avium]
MDKVSSSECLKLDSQTEVFDKEGGGKDLFSPAMVPLNCDTPIIDNNSKEPETEPWTIDITELTEEELRTYFHVFRGPPSHRGGKSDESKAKESATKESKDERKRYIGECQYCLKVDEHPTEICSYRYKVPEDAIVGERCVVACRVCGCLFRDSRCADCGTSLGCAILKECLICRKEGEHFTFECPKCNRNNGFTCDPYTGCFSVEIFPLEG